MKRHEYQEWWNLHLRSARGEELPDSERTAYEEGLKQLHAEEVLADNLPVIREVREAVMAMDAKCDELHARRQQLKAEIAALEAALTPEMRKNLGIGE